MAEGIKEIFTWKDDDGNAHVVPVDVVPSHSDDRTAEVTTHPVEKGANINDHIIQQPDTLSLEICQTQSPFITPIQDGAAFSAPIGFSAHNVPLNVQPNAFKPGGLLFLTRGVGAAIAAIGGALGLSSPDAAPSVTVITADGPTDRIGDLHDALIKVKTEGRFCTVTFRGRIYPNYVVTKVGWKTQKNEVGLGRFSLELQSINIVATDTADLPNPASLRLKPVATSAKPPKPVGDPQPDGKGTPIESLASKAAGHSGA